MHPATPKKSSPPCVSIEVEAQSQHKVRLPPQHDVSIKESVTETTSVSPLRALFERTWVWFVVVLYVASLGLSIVSLTRTSSDWLVSPQDQGEGRVGWSKGCVDRVTYEGKEQTILPCSAADSTESLETIINSSTGSLGQTIFIASLILWTLPIVLVFASSWFEPTRGTCCHGFSIALLWGIGGMALIVVGVLFQGAVNDQQTSNQSMRWSVTCTTDQSREISVCTDVTSLSNCPLKCRFDHEEVGVCSGFSRCTLHEREATCEEDSIGCALQIGWALYASFSSSALMVCMAILLAAGSWTVSQSL